MIKENVESLLNKIPQKNKFGEKVTLVAAVKFQSPEDINTAIAAGITAIGDNHVQELRDKYELIKGNPERHFIGRLQTNKIKYLLGKVDLYHSVDRYNLAEELSKRSERAGVTSNILIEINVGGEESKGGFSYEEAETAYKKIAPLAGLNVVGLMAMLPESDDKEYLKELAQKMRTLYDCFKDSGAYFKYLSMGMSGDWKICLDAGSNMIRLGTAIFGARNYNKQT